MKSLRLMLLLAVTMLTVGASAKIEKIDEVYMLETKNNFLIERDEYSHQLKVYLTEKLQLKDRVCIVFFYTKKKKAEKEYLKLMKKYKKGYDVRYINATQFKFEAIDSDPEEE